MEKLIMYDRNLTTGFLILGFPEITGYWAVFLFVMILLLYILTLLINAMVMVLVSIKPQLHSPMYFFLQQLSVIESVFLTVIVPNMLRVIWLEGAMVSIWGCIIQTYLYCAIGCAECHLLTVMAYDRYLAICLPLHYSSIMNTKLQHSLVIYCWVFGFLLIQITLVFLSQLHYCGPHVIDHFFCDLVPFVKLSCSYKLALQLEIMILSIIIIIIPFVLVIISYVSVFITIFGISSPKGKKKTFSTCSSHLTVVTMYYGTLISIYMVPADGETLAINKLISFLYIVVTPLLNPIIYSLRNEEIRLVLVNLLQFDIRTNGGVHVQVAFKCC
ncbi:olfactory receptor 6F1-like [Engystomops pustulosus]|uniref:olfactory receptor 6F1-like n=1 Tax=Engystomops pustulosus TaxID=76066 RepID=UPI003AFB3612